MLTALANAVRRQSNPKSIDDALELLNDSDIASLLEEMQSAGFSIESVTTLEDFRANLDDLEDVVKRMLKEIRSLRKDIAED